MSVFLDTSTRHLSPSPQRPSALRLLPFAQEPCSPPEFRLSLCPLCPSVFVLRTTTWQAVVNVLQGMRGIRLRLLRIWLPFSAFLRASVAKKTVSDFAFWVLHHMPAFLSSSVFLCVLCVLCGESIWTGFRVFASLSTEWQCFVPVSPRHPVTPSLLSCVLRVLCVETALSL